MVKTGVLIAVAVLMAVAVLIAVAVPIAVAVLVAVAVLIAVAVRIAIAVLIAVEVLVAVEVLIAVAVLIAVVVVLKVWGDIVFKEVTILALLIAIPVHEAIALIRSSRSAGARHCSKSRSGQCKCRLHLDNASPKVYTFMAMLDNAD